MDINKINTEIKQTMDSLDNWQPLHTDDFFTTRTLNRLDSSNDNSGSISINAAMKIAIVAAVFIVNSATFGYFILSNNDVSTSNSDLATVITNEYSMEGYASETNYIFE